MVRIAVHDNVISDPENAFSLSLDLLAGWRAAKAFRFREDYIVFLESDQDSGFWILDSEGKMICNKFDIIPSDFSYDIMSYVADYVFERFFSEHNDNKDDFVSDVIRFMFFGKFDLFFGSFVGIVKSYAESPGASYSIREADARKLGPKVMLVGELLHRLKNASISDTGSVIAGIPLSENFFYIGYKFLGDPDNLWALTWGNEQLPFVLVWQESGTIYFHHSENLGIMALNDDYFPAFWRVLIGNSIIQDNRGTPALAAQAVQDRCAVLVSNPHLGHHIWNELSFIDRIIGKAGEHEKSILALGDCPCGNLVNMFPEIEQNITKIKLGIDNYESRKDLFLSNQKFMMRAGSTYVQKSVRDRYVRHLTKCHADQADWRPKYDYYKNIYDQSGFDASVVINIRVGDRSWDDQAAGLHTVIERILREFSRTGFIFTGSNRGGYTFFGGFQLTEQIISSENEIVEAIVSKFQDKKNFINVVGESVETDVYLCRLANGVIAPWGAGLAKYRWLLNLRAFVYSNSKVMSDFGDRDIYSSPIYMEEPTEMEFFPAEFTFPGNQIYKDFLNSRDTFKLDTDQLQNRILQNFRRWRGVTGG